MANYLIHHGIKGQKWGVRNYQNPDGSLTEEGLRRYGRDRGAGNAKYSRKAAGKLFRERNNVEDAKLDSLVGVHGKYRKELDRLNAQYYDGRTRTTVYNQYGEKVSESRTNTAASSWAGRKHDELYSRAEMEASEAATKAIAEKYGSTAVKDINRYENQNLAIALSSTIALTAGITYAMLKYGN